MTLTVGSLFSGIGGLDLGLESGNASCRTCRAAALRRWRAA